MPPVGTPLVATIAKAAELFDLDVGRLAGAVEHAQLQPWGTHASGQPVYSFEPLATIAAELGGRPGPSLSHAWRQYGDRGRRNRYEDSRS